MTTQSRCAMAMTQHMPAQLLPQTTNLSQPTGLTVNSCTTACPTTVPVQLPVVRSTSYGPFNFPCGPFNSIMWSIRLPAGAHPSVAPHSYKFCGIRNGIDLDLWDPENNQWLPVGFSDQNVEEGKAAARKVTACPIFVAWVFVRFSVFGCFCDGFCLCWLVAGGRRCGVVLGVRAFVCQRRAWHQAIIMWVAAWIRGIYKQRPLARVAFTQLDLLEADPRMVSVSCVPFYRR